MSAPQAYRADAVYFDPTVRSAKEAEMRSGLLAALHPHFSALLSLLRAEAVASVKAATKAATAPGGGGFGDAAEAARGRAVAAFASAAAEAAPEGAEEWAAAAKQVQSKARTTQHQ